MLYSDGKAVEAGKQYRVSWQKFSGSIARYNFTCVARKDPSNAERIIMYDVKTHNPFTEDYLRLVRAKISHKK